MRRYQVTYECPEASCHEVKRLIVERNSAAEAYKTWHGLCPLHNVPLEAHHVVESDTLGGEGTRDSGAG